MAVRNFINYPPSSGGGGGVAYPTTQPTTPGLWYNNGVLTDFDGTTNTAVDKVEGTIFDAFGNVPIGDS